ncbi:hypothetical protein [Bacillus sp. PS06]|uniref:hypothetical protein n=1 Tax=Bacillus sp. PS06 TaxID=2764176 RepID=UPI00177BB276|nr:hypothetical protein [Bacillus sp. PS06]MBD8070678.1 hypothetical protein [Bacillus sp. PS06]
MSKYSRNKPIYSWDMSDGGSVGMVILIGAIIGFLYLYLMNKFVGITMAFFEHKGVNDQCLKVFPSLSFIFLSSYIMYFFIPEPIKKFTGAFYVFTYFSGAGLIVLLFFFIVVKPICPTCYKKIFN